LDKQWKIKEPPSHSIREFAESLDLHPLAGQVLFQRGYDKVEKAKSFLDAKLSGLPHPYLMLGLEKAAVKIANAMERADPICVYGDYDVDGVTSTALLVDFFRACGYPATYRLPNRSQDGYGFHPKAVKELAEKGVKLIITVDCGISGHEACQTARELGVSVIITDHHEILEELPPADSVVNPHQEGCGFAQEPLAGVGIAFFLAAGIRLELHKRGRINKKNIDLKQFLDLVTLGTVADMAPIIGVNRIMVSHGLTLIGKGTRPGIKGLKNISRLTVSKVLCGHISFQLAPRINAAGRMDDAGKGVELLLSQDDDEVEYIAGYLEQENQRRQKVEAEIQKQAVDQFLSNPKYKELYSILLAGQNWHSGVIGIVASRIQEEFYRPTMLVAIKGDYGQGSARSIAGFDIIQAINRCSGYLERFGGHKYAAGFKIKKSNIKPFAVAFEKEARSFLSPEDLSPVLRIDSRCDLQDIDTRLVKSLARLAPFGIGASEPVFVAYDAKVDFKRVVGKTHLKLRLAWKKGNISAIAFGKGDLIDKIDERIDLAFTIGLNEYKGQSEIQLTIKEIRIVDGIG